RCSIFCEAEDGIRDRNVTGVQTCALPIWQKYQEGTFDSVIPLVEILNFLEKHDVPKKDAIVYSGTVPLINGFVYGDGYRCGIHSDKLNKTISIEYKLDKLEE